jgi:hypothetical protein
LSSDIDDIEAFHKSGKKDLKGFAKTLWFGAEARTLTSILDASKSPLIIDFLSLDVEGAELAVLSGIDFGKYKFKFILVECRDIFRLKAFLGENQYSFIEQLSNHDYLFAHNSTNLSN